MPKAKHRSRRLPRGTKPVIQAFFEALKSIPELAAEVAKAAHAGIRDALKAQREKARQEKGRRKLPVPGWARAGDQSRLRRRAARGIRRLEHGSRDEGRRRALRAKVSRWREIMSSLRKHERPRAEPVLSWYMVASESSRPIAAGHLVNWPASCSYAVACGVWRAVRFPPARRVADESEAGVRSRQCGALSAGAPHRALDRDGARHGAAGGAGRFDSGGTRLIPNRLARRVPFAGGTTGQTARGLDWTRGGGATAAGVARCAAGVGRRGVPGYLESADAMVRLEIRAEAIRSKSPWLAGSLHHDLARARSAFRDQAIAARGAADVALGVAEALAAYVRSEPGMPVDSAQLVLPLLGLSVAGF